MLKLKVTPNQYPEENNVEGCCEGNESDSVSGVADQASLRSSVQNAPELEKKAEKPRKDGRTQNAEPNQLTEAYRGIVDRG
jgi:hypothetical protein